MKRFKIELRSGQIERISAHENDTPEAWLKDQGKHVLLNGTTYLKDDIVRVTEHKTHKGSTNMEGV